MKHNTKRITILLADDHTIVREGLRRMIELDTDLEVIGEARDGREAVAMTTELRPDVVLMDIAMPGLNGLEATRQLIKTFPSIKIIILTAHNDDAYVQSAVDSGAYGFLLKQASTDEVCRAIRLVHSGKPFYTQSVAKRFTHLNTKRKDSPTQIRGKAAQLSSREMEVLQLIAEGKANKQTADELCISIKTVEKHRGKLMEKLDIHDTAGLTRYAIAAGIVECSVQTTVL